MALYKIEFKVTFQKDIRGISRVERKKILGCIDSLAVNPRPPGCKKLTGQNRYRIRQGDYRIIYEIYDDKLVVWVVKVGHRKAIYRVSEGNEKYTAGNLKIKKTKSRNKT